MMRLAALLLCLATPATSQDTAAAIAQAAADRLENAGEQLARAQGARNRVAALTETVQAYEDGLVAMRDGLRRAAIRQSTLETDLQNKSAEVSRLLGVLQSMGRAPTPLLLLHPTGPTGTARSGMMVADVTPAIQAEADALRAQLEEVALLRTLQQSATQTLQDGLEGAQAARAALSTAVQERTDLPRRFTDDGVQTALLLASTDTLDSFAAGLSDALLSDVAPAADPAAVKGDLSLPVQGQLLRRYNAEDAAGVARPGIIIAARPRAIVTSPVPATILFRGPLLDYGNVVIIEPAADVLFVIAGLAEVYGEAGQVIPAGAPLGLLGGDQPAADAILTGSDGNSAVIASGGQSQTLYLEVREGQSPVDPATWFALE
ncbi:murein hydrolase activator EnvC family protein [Yoonia sp. 208BN28-4]|uniref:murein hydrolase activator EnvC family protein n=1 Tax=Yoonia sp. 208BN28-4 TaxID=3126505 RepID=UPI003095A044